MNRNKIPPEMLREVGLDPSVLAKKNGHAPGLPGSELVPNGSELLHKLAAYVRRYVVLTEEQADLVAL